MKTTNPHSKAGFTLLELVLGMALIATGLKLSASISQQISRQVASLNYLKALSSMTENHKGHLLSYLSETWDSLEAAKCQATRATALALEKPTDLTKYEILTPTKLSVDISTDLMTTIQELKERYGANAIGKCSADSGVTLLQKASLLLRPVNPALCRCFLASLYLKKIANSKGVYQSGDGLYACVGLQDKSSNRVMAELSFSEVNPNNNNPVACGSAAKKTLRRVDFLFYPLDLNRSDLSPRIGTLYGS